MQQRSPTTVAVHTPFCGGYLPVPNAPLARFTITMPETAEELCQQPEVREELARATGQTVTATVKPETKDKLWFVTHALLIAASAVLYLLVGSHLIPLPPLQVDLARRLLRSFALIVAIIALAKAIRCIASGASKTPAPVFRRNGIETLPAL